MEYPPMALALLKSILHRNGYDVALSDAGLEYWKHCGGTNSEFMLRSMDLQNLSAKSMEDIDQRVHLRQQPGRLLPGQGHT
jgi:hypothetical protein